MDEKLYRLMAFLTFCAVVIWIIASALGRRHEAAIKPNCTRPPKAQGAVWARSNVPAASSQPLAAAIQPIYTV